MNPMHSKHLYYKAMKPENEKLLAVYEGMLANNQALMTENQLLKTSIEKRISILKGWIALAEEENKEN